MEYILTYRRVMTVVPDDPEATMSMAELIEYAKESLHDPDGMWSVSIDDGGEWWAIPRPTAPVGRGLSMKESDRCLTMRRLRLGGQGRSHLRGRQEVS